MASFSILEKRSSEQKKSIWDFLCVYSFTELTVLPISCADNIYPYVRKALQLKENKTILIHQEINGISRYITYIG